MGGRRSERRRARVSLAQAVLRGLAFAAPGAIACSSGGDDSGDSCAGAHAALSGRTVTNAFREKVEACAAGIPCDAETDFSEACFPDALAESALGSLSDGLITACIRGSTSDCEAAVATATGPEEGEVAACLRRWVECQPELPDTDPRWTEDHCTTLLALSEERRRAGGDCLTRACGGVAACLVDSGAFNF